MEVSGGDAHAVEETTTPTERREDDGEEEMPLLFMDGLPSDFKRNAQLAALLTLMPSDDEDAGPDKGHDHDHDQDQGHAVRHRRVARRQVREPYARVGGATPHKKTRKKTPTGAQELSLYLSMFSVSNE